MTLSRMPFRPLMFGLFALCAAMLGFGLYLQLVVGLHPCPMCIMQRYALVAVGLIALVGGLQGPRAWGQRVYATLIGASAIAGAGVAANQSWLQLHPPGIAECGPGLEYLMESFPLTEVLPMLFRGAGDCSAIDWTFLGLSLANWSLLSFSAILLFSVWLLLRGKQG